jgi:hypothetical protein
MASAGVTASAGERSGRRMGVPLFPFRSGFGREAATTRPERAALVACTN